MTRGRLITIEGVDGAGKTTVAAGLAEALEARGLPVHLTREPGGVAIAERIRELLGDPGIPIPPRAEALLYAAARAALVEQDLRPRLAEGRWIVLDRFVDSSLAYQGAGRGLGIDDVSAINRVATEGLVPDRTLLLRVQPSTGRSRLAGRGGAGPDRLEREAAAFFLTVARAYDELALADPGRFRTIDAEQAPDAVLRDALAALADLLESSDAGLVSPSP